MWTKRDKRLEPLFIKPSSSHLEMTNYFHFHGTYPTTGHNSAVANAIDAAPTVLWSANSLRRKRFEPFCVPVTHHIPIKQRLNLAGHASLNTNACSNLDRTSIAWSNPCCLHRRRRMSLLQTLRYQNRMLADGRTECRSKQSVQDSEAAKFSSERHHHHHRRSSYPSPFSSSEQKDSMRNSPIIKLKNKTFAFFGKRSSKRRETGDVQISSGQCIKYYQSDNENDQPIYSSIDLNAKEAQHSKLQATIDDNNHANHRRGIVGDVAYKDDGDKSGDCCTKQQKIVAVIERSPALHSETKLKVNAEQCKCQNLRRSTSCPHLRFNEQICHEICRRTTSNRPEFAVTDNEKVDVARSDLFMCAIEKSLIADKNHSNKNINGSSATKAPLGGSCEATDCIIEEEKLKCARKLEQNCSLHENSYEIDSNEEFRLLQEQLQQQQRNLPITKKLQHLRLCNGYANENFPHASSNSTRNSSLSSISTETKRCDNEEELKRCRSTEAFLQSELGKELVGYYPELHSLPSFYSDGENDDDNLSSLRLDHYLPPKYSSSSIRKECNHRSSSLSSLITHLDSEDALLSVERQRSNKVGIVTQTDLSLVHVNDQLSSYLSDLALDRRIQRAAFFTYQGMNFLAKHFFEYQSLNNRPHYAVQLHKLPPSEASADQSASWAPKSMIKAGKNQAAPAARANRANVELKLGAHRYGRAAKHEFREWGDKHGELKGEKLASHKDALTKFLSNEESAPRNLFDCEFEERIFQTEPETLPEQLARSSKNDGIDLSLSLTNNTTATTKYGTEVLTILTYAPNVQFVTATVKKAKLLPFNNKPFARVMLFDGRRLLEQKQTTVTPTFVCNKCIAIDCFSTRQKPPTPSSPSSSSSAGCSNTALVTRPTDAIFSESFLFHITPQMLDKCHIVIEMFDTDPSNCNRGPISIGHCVIGPMCRGAGCAHWLQMIRKTGLPICMWHRLFKS